VVWCSASCVFDCGGVLLLLEEDDNDDADDNEDADVDEKPRGPRDLINRRRIIAEEVAPPMRMLLFILDQIRR